MGEPLRRQVSALAASLRPWLFLAAVLGLISALGLGGILRLLTLGLGLLILAPVVISVIAQWWLRRNWVSGPCPVCGQTVQGLNQTQTQCPTCLEPLQVTAGRFERLTPPGTVDVQAVDVQTPDAPPGS